MKCGVSCIELEIFIWPSRTASGLILPTTLIRYWLSKWGLINKPTYLVPCF